MEFDVRCSLCRTALRSGEAAYGLTSGCIDDDCEGFRMDIDDKWDIYCTDCMNDIDKLLSNFQQERSK